MVFQLLNKMVSLCNFYIFIKIIYKDDNIQHQAILKQHIQNLGIVFIKLAQWYSSFSSISNHSKPNMVKICESFQTQVLIKEETKDWIFNDFVQKNIKVYSIQFLARGSIGTVYTALTKNNQKVVIKVRHSKVKEDFEIWCSLIGLFYFLVKPFIHCDATDVIEMLKSQFDFRKEGENMIRFGDIYEKENSILKIPKLYYCCENLLVTEFVNSFKNDSNLPLTFPEKVEKMCLLKCWILDQIILKRKVHGDLHNGNWGITTDKQSIVLYDLGYIFEIPDLSMDFMVTLLKKDSVDISEKVLELFSIPKETKNLKAIKKLTRQYSLEKKFTFDFIIELLRILYSEKLVIFNKKVAFLLNLVMCLNHIHQVEFLQNSNDSMEYNYLTCQRFNVLEQFREEIIYDLFLKS